MCFLKKLKELKIPPKNKHGAATRPKQAVCRTFKYWKCGIQVQQIESQLTLYPHCKELCCCASISTDIENQGKTKHQYFLFLFIEVGNISLLQLLQRQGCKATKSHTNSKTNSARLCNSALYFDHMIMMQNYIIMQNFPPRFSKSFGKRCACLGCVACHASFNCLLQLQNHPYIKIFLRYFQVLRIWI